MSDIRTRLILGQVASCTCNVKTPAVTHHKLDCRYRITADALWEIERLDRELAKPLSIWKKFPSMLRKMWSAGEVVGWLKEQEKLVPHTPECLYQHFLAYTGYPPTPELRKAYYHGRDADDLAPVSDTCPGCQSSGHEC